MVSFCAVMNCSNRGDRDNHMSFFRFPRVAKKDDKTVKELKTRRQRQWLANINRADIAVERIQYYRVCSEHFITGKPASLEDETNPDWAPTQKMGHGHQALTKAVTECNQKRHKRAVRREIHKLESVAVEGLLELHVEEQEDMSSETTRETQTDIVTNEVGVQTSMSSSDIEVLEAQASCNNAEVANARQEAHQLKLTEDSFVGDDKKTKFYTGLPTFAVLTVVLNYVKGKLPKRHLLTQFQKLLIVLMKLRLAMPHADLGYCFLVSEATISRVFNTGINALYGLTRLIVWPERDVLWKTMPMQFRRTFGKRVAVIIDCFEVFCNRPTSLEARAQTWSNYKHHNTVNFLVGITPCGVISFLSAAWGGRGTDKTITLDSNLFEHLLPQDIILADRGFDIKDDAWFYGCQVEIPAFTKGKPQLSPLDVEKTRDTAHLRIHVERVIGGLRQKYTMLNHTLPLEVMVTDKDNPVPKIDKIARVCCALFNLSDL